MIDTCGIYLSPVTRLMITFYDWHHLPSGWQQDNTESDLGEKKRGWGHLDPTLFQDKTCFLSTVFKDHLKVTNSWDLKGMVGSHRSLKVLWEKKELKGMWTFHLVTHHCQFSFLILRKWKALPLFTLFCLFQFNPEKLRISGVFVLFPLWSIYVFPFLTLHVKYFFAPGSLTVWQKKQCW